MIRSRATEILPYLAVAVGAVLLSLYLGDDLSTPLWGALSDAHFR